MKAWLLHLANANPPFSTRQEFYTLKHRLLKRYGHFEGHQIQEIRKDCWGPGRINDAYGEYEYQGCRGETCPRCRGTGVFDIRWVRLERWTWGRYVFHVPSGDTRVIPSPYPPRDMIRGRIEHLHDHQRSREALLWLYLLCGQYRTWWHECGGHNCTCRLYPLLNLHRVVAKLRSRFSRRTCGCGRRFWTWGTGWGICPRCRRQPVDEMPF